MTNASQYSAPEMSWRLRLMRIFLWISVLGWGIVARRWIMCDWFRVGLIAVGFLASDSRDQSSHYGTEKFYRLAP